MTSPPEARPEEILDTALSSQGLSIFKKWLQWNNNKLPTSHKRDRASATAHDQQPRPQSIARADATDEGPSTLAAGQRVRVNALP